MADAGYLLVGTELVPDDVQTYRSQGVLLRTNDLGEQVWRASCSGPDGLNTEFKHAIITNDGNIAVAGLYGGWEQPFYTDLFLGLYNSTGELLWSRHVGGVYQEWGFQVRELPGGGYAVGGWQATPLVASNWYAMYLAGFNEVGDTL